jgi:hypothetical protein
MGIRRTRVTTAIGSEQGYVLAVAQIAVFGLAADSFPCTCSTSAMVRALEAELIGPYSELADSIAPSRTYLTGFLVPRRIATPLR